MKRASLLVAASLALLSCRQADAGDVSFFEARIRPVLVERCYACHSQSAGKTKGGLALDTKDAIRKGGATGPAVVPGKPGESLLLAAVKCEGEETPSMPPKVADRLSKAQIADFERWINDGAEDPRTETAATVNLSKDPAHARKTYWAFQPISDPKPPAVKTQGWARNDVDKFLLAAIEAKGLAPAPDADKRTLIRRATFDLTGLPPTVDEVEAFLADASPTAFETVVDRLLASPRYGERWGRHWLDLVRYADTSGCNADFPVPQSARYRDYVIQAFNRDTPYDRFLAQQIAGDLLPSKSESERVDGLVATGYLAIARRFGSHGEEFHLTIDDEIDNLGKVALGLSISCARCHDHKFDPIPQRDYYALYGIFASTKHAFAGTELPRNPKDFVALGGPGSSEALRKIEADVIGLEAKVERLEKERSGGGGRKKAAESKDAKPPRTREVVTAELEQARASLKSLRIESAKIEKAYAVSEGAPADARIHKKGDPKDRGEIVRRGFLTVLGGATLAADAKESGRRELAAWLTDRANPLTARVAANRVWQYHFGRGIVASPNDFGVRGDRPSHPELLDWLASRLVGDGWSIKSLHRRIMLSHAYATSTEGDPKAATIDPKNDLVSHFSRRRLSAEEIRDAMLFVSGKLELGAPGRHAFPPETDWRYTQHSPFVAVYPSDRRGVYLMQQRIKKHPLLDVFDGADPNATTADRPVSITALQALFLLNDRLVHTQADALADRLIAAKSDDRGRIDLAFQLLYGRPASPDELATASAYLDSRRADLVATDVPPDRRGQAALASFARVLLGSNEFLYVD